ncbi:MAG: histidine kinase [Lachnospiraceae bacterium]|nr:histidine kinase [Lachnospiraceae bacterium]
MKGFWKKWKDTIRARMDRVPLWAEFTLFMAMIMILLTVVMSFSIYRREQRRTIDSFVTASERLLSLKMANLEEYVRSLSDYAVLPVFDSSLYAAMQGAAPLSDEMTEEIRRTVRTYFYTRKDLLSYHIHLLNHGLVVGRDYGKEGVSFRASPGMPEGLTLNRRNYAVLPSEHPGVLFRFVHSIIRVEDRSIVGYTEFEVNPSGIAYSSSQSISPGEVLNLYNREGELLYTNALEGLREQILKAALEENRQDFGMTLSSQKPVYKDIDGSRYLVISVGDQDGALILSSMTPVEYILSELRQTRLYAALIGLAFLAVAVIGAHLLIRYLSAPLTALAAVQESFGEGQIMDVHLGRSRESAELSRSFNQMTRRIDTLLKENYAAELNEKNARLAALEAQVNPHFLYNTLQAVGTEALLNDQPEIYRMLTSLASSLRYSIKAPKVVTLGDELKYVDDYVMLQKLRMGDRLQVEYRIDPGLKGWLLPKMSIQTLVENSILHGIGGGRDSIRVTLTARIGPKDLKIIVSDDGIGIPEEELSEIKSGFRTQTLTDPNPNIGLANLYNRLLLLYGTDMAMELKSRTGEGSYTEVVLTLPLKSMGEKEDGHAQDPDH